MQTDPIDYGDDMNMYNYVGSDPGNRSDPSGLSRLTNVYTSCYGNCAAGDYWNIPHENWSGLPSGMDTGGTSSRSPGTGPSTTNANGDIVVTGGPKVFVSWSSMFDHVSLVSSGGASAQTSYPPQKEKGLLDYAREAFCALPPIEISGGADAYLGIGASASLGISLDILTLQVRGSVGATLGAGFGGGLGVGLGGGASKPGVATEITGTVAGGPGSITVGQGGVGGGTGPKFGPQLGAWGGVAGKYTTPATPDLTGACK